MRRTPITIALPGPAPDNRHDWQTIKTLLPYLMAWKGRVFFALSCLLLAKLTNVAVPLVFKDIIDTCDMPTQMGSPIYKGHRPKGDAACVALARKAGGILLGKTVTTEFANRHPGKTHNPFDFTRTPGGSSSGSAAAVGDHMVPLAIGTQTTASTIRPASFCGTFGYRPTHGDLRCVGHQRHQCQCRPAGKNRGQNHPHRPQPTHQPGANPSPRQKPHLAQAGDPANFGVVQRQRRAHVRQQRGKQVHATRIRHRNKTGQ